MTCAAWTLNVQAAKVPCGGPRTRSYDPAMTDPAEYGNRAGTPTTGERRRIALADDAAHHLRMLLWVATLLPPSEYARATAELGATGLAAVAALHFPVERDGSNEGDTPAAVHVTDEQLIPALRAARTVPDCDALLDAAPVEWDAVAAAHAREPFGPTPSRALIARRDCPDALTVALLTPWRVQVADRLAARQKDRPRGIRGPGGWYPRLPSQPYELPDTIRHLLLPHLSHLRPPLLRLLLTADTTHEVVRATTRLDRLLAAVDHCDGRHVEKMHAFWDAVGAQLRDALGEDRKAWTTTAERLPRHRGSLRDLLDGLDEPLPGSRRRTPDLRVLVEAPPKVLAAIVAELDDDALDRALSTGFARVRVRGGLLAIALSRLGQAGVPPRRLFARWARGLRGREIAVADWLYGPDEKLDEKLVQLAVTHPDLRRRLAAAQPQRPPAADLVAGLRSGADPVQPQLVLDHTVLTRARPAGAVLRYAYELSPDDPGRAALHETCEQLFTDAARRSGPGFWYLLAGRLPTFKGTLPELLALRTGDATAGWLHELSVAEPESAGHVDALLARYETQVHAAVAHLRPGAEAPAALGFPDREAALRWLDAERDTLPAVARLASTVRPGLTIALPRLLDRYLHVQGRIAELIPLAELARQTAVRVGDRHGEGIAWGDLGIALSHLRYDGEAVPVFEHARALLREAGDRDREGRVSRNLGHSLRSLRKYPEAISAYQHARTLFREAGLPAREGNVCRDLGRVFRQSGRVAEAAAAYREAIALFTESGRERELNETKRNLHDLIEPTVSTPEKR